MHRNGTPNSCAMPSRKQTSKRRRPASSDTPGRPAAHQPKPRHHDADPATGRRTTRPAAAAGTPGSTGSSDPEYARQLTERRRQRRILTGAVIGLVLLVVAGLGGMQLWRTHRSPQAPGRAQPSAPAAKPEAGEPITFGSSSAPVTISVYEDFQCPHCQNFESEVGGTVSDLVRAGRLQVKDYPLTFVKPDGASLDTANAFACATQAGFGPAYRTGLFANDKLAWTDNQLIKLGTDIDSAKAESSGFAGCVQGGKQHSWLDSIAKVANQKKVDETPTVFLNGHRKSGAAEWDAGKLRDEVQSAK